MAGGKSSRMGTDKGLMDFKGKPMVQYAIDLLSGIFETVVISANHPAYEQFGLKVIPDIHQNCGPIGGLHAVLSNLETKHAFVLSCDTPLMDESTLKQLLEAMNGESMVVPEVANNFEPLCAIYSVQLVDELEKRIKSGDLKMHQMIKKNTSKKVVHCLPEPFQNINSLDDLNALQ